ncbi:MAG: TatD family hydrolase [Elainellaceae cyanobacterium]
MQLIDTHVHLNFETFQSDLDDVAQRWREVGVARMIHSCVEPAEFSGIQALADRFSELSFAVGLHPLDVDRWTVDLATEIRALARSDARVVAIGETGLDFFKSDNHEQQYLAFESQLAIARDLSLPVIIHCRDAATSMADRLEEIWSEDGVVRGVMHCWSGTPEETQRFLDLGFYISFSGIVTFKNATQVHESAQMVPSDRLLIETDCPFLAPVPMRGKGRNQPAYVRFVAERLAELRNVPFDTIAHQTAANACELFKLPPLVGKANDALASSTS